MRCLLVVVAATLAAGLVVPARAHAEQRYAVVIGANPGWSSDRPLRFAEQDAERVRDVLVALGGFSPDRVVLLRDPDTSEVRATLRDLARTAQSSSEETLVFFYYSGHADDERLHLRGEILTHKELHATLRALPATIKLAVIDACKSGAVTHKGGRQVDEFDVSVDSPKLSGMVILTSSGADELSQESRTLAGSVFTHHLVSALRGAADDNNDREVTVTEAYHYAYQRTRADTSVGGAKQRPSFEYELSGQGELVLAHLKQSKTAQMTVPKGGDFKYVVLDAHEWRLIAEARSDKTREVVLALAPGNYRVKRVLADRLEVGSLALAAGDRADVAKLAYESAPLSAGIVKGDPGELPADERREVERAQAFGLLADGKAQAALAIFDRLLNETNSDVLAWRGRGRALVRIAEAYQRVDDHVHERMALGDALKADPSLSEDPMFQLWYKRLGELDARAQSAADAKQRLEADIRKNPRATKRYGVGFDIFSGRGLLAFGGTAVIRRVLFASVGFDAAGPGVDAGLVVAPFPSRWSPFLGVGGHLSFGASTTMLDINNNSYSYDEMFGRHARVEVGGQYVSHTGFTTELGFALLVFKPNGVDKLVVQGMPVIHFGWLF